MVSGGARILAWRAGALFWTPGSPTSGCWAAEMGICLLKRLLAWPHKPRGSHCLFPIEKGWERDSLLWHLTYLSCQNVALHGSPLCFEETVIIFPLKSGHCVRKREIRGNNLSVTCVLSMGCWHSDMVNRAEKQEACCCYCCQVAQSCPTLCNPISCSTLGSPVLHYLPEFAQILVH